jgi:hypothetical protein
MPSDGDDRLSLRVDQPPTLPAVLSKEWPYDGQIWDHMAMACAAGPITSTLRPVSGGAGLPHDPMLGAFAAR